MLSNWRTPIAIELPWNTRLADFLLLFERLFAVTARSRSVHDALRYTRRHILYTYDTAVALNSVLGQKETLSCCCYAFKKFAWTKRALLHDLTWPKINETYNVHGQKQTLTPGQ